MSEVISQATGNTPTTGDAQTAASTAPVVETPAAPAVVVPTPSAAPAVSSQQVTEGQPATESVGASTDGKQADASAKPAGAPETYEFKAPDGTSLDASVMTEFSAVAKEQGLSQEAAQKFIDKLAPKMAERSAIAQTEAFEAFKSGLETASRADKEFGGDKLNESLAVANKALDAFGTPELRTLLNTTGLGNHPEIIRAFIKAGKAISEDRFVPGGKAPTKGGRDAASALYPKQQKTA